MDYSQSPRPHLGRTSALSIQGSDYTRGLQFTKRMVWSRGILQWLLSEINRLQTFGRMIVAQSRSDPIPRPVPLYTHLLQGFVLLAALFVIYSPAMRGEFLWD